MLLLYCQNGLVLNTHDDSMAPVPASAYGSGVRIIPWAGLQGDLARSGTKPPPPQPDTRPFVQPTETPAILKLYAGQVRYEASVAGISFIAASGTIPVKTDRISQSLLNNLASHARTMQPTDPISFTQDGIAYAITAQEAIDMFDAVINQIQSGRDIEADCIADLSGATPTLKTYDDIDAQFAGLKSKGLDKPGHVTGL
jgi:hypothetical protein